jgi:SAM-dependent methyltransferase
VGDAGDTVWADDMSAAYERWLVPIIFEAPADDLVARVARSAPADVLELAAGTGVVTRRLVAALPSASITATDLNPAMVTEGQGHAPGATWRQADALALPFDDASFDVVVCQFGVMFFPDRPAGFAEARRVLRPGGRLLVSAWDAVEHNALTAAFMDAVHAVFPEDPPVFLERTPHGYHDLALIEADAHAAGFADAHAERCGSDSRAASPLDMARGCCLGSPMRGELEARGADPEATAQRLAGEMASKLGTGPIAGPLAWIVLEATNAL